VCTARFPRTVYKETIVSEEDGHIFIKKQEAMMNTFTPALTYVMRCNTDVSSLPSGTSLKAIISYVTDYITKPSLKTYQIFSSAYDVYEKNSELIGGDIKAKEAARKLILKIVNSLGSKMEIGSPAASMYLLGNPDHYKSHIFVPFWWKSFVSDVYAACHPPETQPSEDLEGPLRSSVTISDVQLLSNISTPVPCNSVLPLSETDDLDNKDHNPINSHRAGGGSGTINNSDHDSASVSGSSPHNRNNALLESSIPEDGLKCEHIQDCMSQNGRSSPLDQDNVEPMSKIQISVPNYDPLQKKVVIGREGGEYVQRSYIDDYKYRPHIYKNMSLYTWIQCYSKRRRSKKRMDDLADKLVDIKDGKANDSEPEAEELDTKKYQPFLRGHPLYRSFEARCDFTKLEKVVPNFVGGALPRADQGDREYYCMTMLTLFKPWRQGNDLKDANENWDSAFVNHNFNIRERSLLRNFGLKYECLDARDDFHSELKRKSREAHSGDLDLSHGADDSDDDETEDYMAQGEDKFHILGKNTLKICTKMAEVVNIMRDVDGFETALVL